MGARQRHRGESFQSSQGKSNDNNVTLTLDDTDEDKQSTSHNDHRKKKKSVDKIPASFTLISVTVLITLTLLFVRYMDLRLPEALMESDIPSKPESFIEERARRDLHQLTKVGVRVSGSIATDLITVQQFEEILAKIQENVSSGWSIEKSVQRPTGSFWIEDDDGQTSSYSKIANVIAKLEPSDPAFRTNNGILLNCHFDTKPGCPGATDNMISCVVMLEVLRVLSSKPLLVNQIRNPIIFLFNGAEEFGLQGAHGFIRGKEEDPTDERWGHPWAQNLSVFINLEGAGGGGREILFQAAGGTKKQTGWLLQAYKQSPHPYGSVIGEEAFTSGLVPSDTDFRVFRDYKSLPGLDIAYIKNGWVYHTKWDVLSEIPSGSVQHMGDNSLEMAKYLSTLDFNGLEDSAEQVVFFDVLGVFLITYSKTVGIVINVLISLGTIGVIIFVGGWTLKSFLTYATYLGSTLLAWGVGAGVAALVAVMLNGSGYPKPFYSYPSLALILFGLPAVIGETLTYAICLKGSPKDTWLAGKLSVAVLLLGVTFFTRGAYVFLPPLIFGVIPWVSLRYLMRGWPKTIMIFYILLGELIPLILSSYLIFTLTDVFVPILGRAGSEMNGNLFFGVALSAIICIISAPGLISLFVNYDKKVLTILLLISVLLLNPMIVFGFLGKIPYQEKTPMRITINDVQRIWYSDNGTISKSENGYWFWPLDADTDNLFPELAKTVEEIGSAYDEILDYENCPDLYCKQPFLWPTTNRVKKVHWIPKSYPLPQEITDWARMHVVYQNGSSELGQRHFTLEFSGPQHATIVLSPKRGWDANITIQAMGENLPVEKAGKIQWKGRKVYFIYHGRGNVVEPFRMDVNLVRTSGDEEDEHVLDVQQSALFFDVTENTTTTEFFDFMGRFPSWIFPGMSWTAVMKMYTIK